MIPAAGLGSRLGHGLPKCMLEIDGTPILTHLIEALRPHTDRIHVVVGYREELVIDYCAKHHRDIVIVRNPDYRTTNTITSLQLGSRGLTGQLLYVDGDTVIEPQSLSNFIAEGQGHDVLVGIAPAITDDTVYVSVDDGDHGRQVTDFSREKSAEFEWANVLLAPSAVIENATGYVFEALRPQLPIAAALIDLAEVDTEHDLARAQARVAGWRLQGSTG